MNEPFAIDRTLEAPPGYVLQSEDGNYGVERFLFERWRSMSPREKIGLLDQHSACLRELSLAGLRARHPTASEPQIELLAAKLWLGEELFERLLAPHL
jgi:hypothetical protein